MEGLAYDKLNKVLSETGHRLTLDDFDDVAELDALAAKVSGTTHGEARLLFEPFSLCGVLFYPLSVAKSLWYAEKCEEWGVEGSAQEALLFWLLTVPNESHALDLYCDRKKAHKAVRKLSRRLHCSSAQMTHVYEQCVGIESNRSTPGKVNYGGLIHCLLREYGGDAERWLYETPLPMIETLMNKHAERINAEAQARQGSPQQGRAVAPVASERLRALRDLRFKANEIREKWSKQDGEESC